MTITTSRGKTFDIDWMWGPVSIADDVMMQYHDDRAIAEIAADFEGVEHFHRESETEGNKDYDGYTVIQSISRHQRDLVRITFIKPYE